MEFCSFSKHNEFIISISVNKSNFKVYDIKKSQVIYKIRPNNLSKSNFKAMKLNCVYFNTQNEIIILNPADQEIL